jgi:hypothetical protein
MRENKTVYLFSILTGFLIIGAALVRALSVNNLFVAANTGDISKHYSTSVVIDWTLSTVMMLLVGIWILFLASPLKKGQRRAWWQAFVISIFFMAFGGGFWYRYQQSIHLAGFALLGLMLFIPLILFVRRFK